MHQAQEQRMQAFVQNLFEQQQQFILQQLATNPGQQQQPSRSQTASSNTAETPVPAPPTDRSFQLRSTNHPRVPPIEQKLPSTLRELIQQHQQLKLDDFSHHSQRRHWEANLKNRYSKRIYHFNLVNW